EQARPPVEIDAAGGRERRRQRGDATGKMQGEAPRGPAAMLLAAGKRRQVCWPRLSTRPRAFRNTALTDSAARPTANENHLLISAYSTHPQSPLLAVTRRISDSGCNLVDARLSTVGRD